MVVDTWCIVRAGLQVSLPHESGGDAAAGDTTGFTCDHTYRVEHISISKIDDMLACAPPEQFLLYSNHVLVED